MPQEANYFRIIIYEDKCHLFEENPFINSWIMKKKKFKSESRILDLHSNFKNDCFLLFFLLLRFWGKSIRQDYKSVVFKVTNNILILYFSCYPYFGESCFLIVWDFYREFLVGFRVFRKIYTYLINIKHHNSAIKNK